MFENTVKNIVSRQGGYREKNILKQSYTIEKAETWNDQHKVLNILAMEAVADGYRNGFAVDIVAMSICG